MDASIYVTANTNATFLFSEGNDKCVITRVEVKPTSAAKPGEIQ